MWVPPLVLLAGPFLAFPSQAPAEPEVRVNYEYYEIYGDTADLTQSSVSKRLPRLTTSSVLYPIRL